ncbi:MAG: hypothetical protein AABZ60_17865, partial [Planctomycetota bacterium]
PNAEKQKSFQAEFALDPQSFIFHFFFSPLNSADFFQNPFTLFRSISQMDDLRLKRDHLMQQIQKLSLKFQESQEELSLAQSILKNLVIPQVDDSVLSLEQEERKLYENLTQQKMERLQGVEQLEQWEYLKTYLGEYDEHFRQLLKIQLTQKISLLAASFEDFLENQRIAFKERLLQQQKQYEIKKEEWKETLFEMTKIQEFRNAVQCRLQEVQKYLDDRLVRNSKTPREELCLSLSRVAQLTYIQNEVEDVLRDNKIRNFMFYSISLILMLTVPVFFYLKSLQSTYYRDQLKVQTFGGFIVFLILILMWYFSQKLKNNEVLRNYNKFKIRLQEELKEVEQEANCLQKFLYGPISQIELASCVTPELKQIFQQLLFLAQEGRIRFLETIQNRLPIPELNATHLPALWDRFDFSRIKLVEEEMDQLREKTQETESRLFTLRTLEKLLQEISFDYPDQFPSRSYSLENILEPFQEIQNLYSQIRYLEQFPPPSPAPLSKIREIIAALCKNHLPLFQEQPHSDQWEELEFWLKQQKEQLFAQIPSSREALEEQVEQIEKQIQETTRQLLQIQAKRTLHEERNQVAQRLLHESKKWEEKKEQLVQQIPQLAHQLKVQETLAELWKETLEQMESKLVPSLEKTASLYLPLWTHGVLGRLQQTDSGTILIFCQEKNDFVPLDQLGSGLQQLAQIALYCSMLILFSGSSSSENKPFLVLDAPDSPLDTETAQKLLRSLESLHPHFDQILITTRKAPGETKWVLPSQTL